MYIFFLLSICDNHLSSLLKIAHTYAVELGRQNSHLNSIGSKRQVLLGYRVVGEGGENKNMVSLIKEDLLEGTGFGSRI